MLHEVYAASHRYREFLTDGQPVLFDVQTTPGPVVSALRLGDRLLVLRTDFDDNRLPVRIALDGRTIVVPSAPGPQILRME